MNIEKLKALFPNASKSFLQNNILSSRQASKLEPDPGNGPLETGQIQKRLSGRFLVRVTSIRSRLIDEDNLCEKYAVDCCRYAGLIPGDAPGQTKIEVAQRKAAKGETERIEIEISSI